MESKNHTFDFSNRRLISLFLFNVIVSLVFLSGNSIADADGKLRRVKTAVRKHQKTKVAKPGPKQDSHNQSHGSEKSDRHREDHSEHDEQQSRTNRHQHRSSRSTGIVFFAPPQRCVEPDVIPVSPRFPLVVRPEPNFAYQPSYAQPVYEPVVQPVPQLQGVPADEAVSAISISPMVDEIVVANMIGDSWFQNQRSRSWATIGSDFDGITTGGMGLHLQAPHGIGLEGSVMTLRESSGDDRDHLWIGDVNLVYEVLAGEYVRGRVGLGVNWLSDSWGAESGFNLTGGVDLELTNRLVLSAEGDAGNLGDADYFHGRVNLSRRFDACELMLGADHFNIGGAEVNSYFTGIQFRF